MGSTELCLTCSKSNCYGMDKKMGEFSRHVSDQELPFFLFSFLSKICPRNPATVVLKVQKDEPS